MAERLEIEITVETRNASPKVARLQTDLKGLGQAAGQVDNIISSGLNPSLSSFSSLASAGGPVTLALAAALAVLVAAAVAFGFALKEAFAAEQEIAQLNAVLQSTGQVAGVTSRAALDLATSLSKVSGVSDETILAGESILLTFTSIGQKTFPEAAAAALDLSTAFGMDLSSASIMLGKALQDPVQGLTALRRVGVSFSEAQAQMITRMAEGGRVAQAQALILREVNRQVGGSAEAMGATTIGEWNKIKNIIGNAAESIGGVFVPYINAGLGNLRILLEGIAKGAEPGLRAISKAFEDLGRELRKPEMREAIKALGEQIGDMIAQGLPQMLATATQAVSDFARMWAKHGPDIVNQITEILEFVEKLETALRTVSSAINIAFGSGAGGAIPGFAGGVTNFGGGLAVVGERGPETLVLPRGSSVLPDGGAAAREAGGMHIGTLNVYPPPGTSLRDFLRGMNNTMSLGTSR